MQWFRRRLPFAHLLIAFVLWASTAEGRSDAAEQAEFARAIGRIDVGVNNAFGTGLVPRSATPATAIDISGPGAVLTVGSVVMKVTNAGLIGNPFPNLSNDPSCQWPSVSGTEYMNLVVIGVGAVNPTATDPSAVRRVSYFPEWTPLSLDPGDRQYRSYDGIVNGNRLLNDDSDVDPRTGESSIDEDFLDGRDNDGDGRVDEDYGALGQMMYSCTMRDDTPAGFAASTAEAHVPVVLEARQTAWAYSVPGFADFDVVQWDVYNRSGHTIDSVYFGFLVDLDAGPLAVSTFFSDDFDLPAFPSGEFLVPVDSDDPRFQDGLNDAGLPDTLCPERRIRINGFSLADDNGDEGRTPGVPSFLLFGHTIDPLGLRAPARVGFRAFRSYVQGTPYVSNGGPGIDQQRFEFMSSNQNISPETGFISTDPGDQPADYRAWCSVGPFLNVRDGGMVSCTFGLAVKDGNYVDVTQYPNDYIQYQAGMLSLDDLFEKYPALENAFTAQVAYEGAYEVPRPGFSDQVPDCSGCETGIKLPNADDTPIVMVESCPDREAAAKQVTGNAYTWFDFDCDYCTGVYDKALNQGYFLRHWNAESPPPNPTLNVASTYNYTDNPDRVVPGGDNQIILAWDNLSENTPDPKTGVFDFRSYRVWKVAGWVRDVGASGPNDEEWALMAEFRLFDHADSNFSRDPVGDSLLCPKIKVPSYRYPAGHPHCSSAGADPLQIAGGGCRDTATIPVCLRKGDFWDRQSGYVLRPENVDCVRVNGSCLEDSGIVIGRTTRIKKTRYPVGRYRYADPEVKNGFIYFYSVTAGDSTSGTELYGRRSAVEADAVTPQSPTLAGQQPWVVPNPYRGFSNVRQRPSAWDLVPNATDPTGTHVDFMGLPSGRWKIRIYTVSGDLVAELHEDDPVNDSVRGGVTGPDGVTRPGYNRQQDHANDGQARWNLITRNGQDVVSGIYVFVVDSDQGQQRGRFVVIR